MTAEKEHNLSQKDYNEQLPQGSEVQRLPDNGVYDVRKTFRSKLARALAAAIVALNLSSCVKIIDHSPPIDDPGKKENPDSKKKRFIMVAISPDTDIHPEATKRDFKIFLNCISGIKKPKDITVTINTTDKHGNTLGESVSRKVNVEDKDYYEINASFLKDIKYLNVIIVDNYGRRQETLIGPLIYEMDYEWSTWPERPTRD
ncbi:hypothetical protein KKG71_00365 [Patescibacteria group bacterium]|nr:hypothetical protein [Patescibacteria group bacterium]